MTPATFITLISLTVNALLVMSFWSRVQTAGQTPSMTGAEQRSSSLSNTLPGDVSPEDARFAIAHYATPIVDRYLNPALADPRAVAKRMKAEGYPEVVRRGVVAELLERRTNYDAVMQKAFRNGIAKDEQSALLKKGNEISDKVLVEVDEILGAQLPEEDFAAFRKRLKYGDLEAFKIDALEKLTSVSFVTEDDYREAVDHVLSAGEAEDYWRYNSSTAKRTQSRLSVIDVDEPTYLKLLSAEQAMDRPTNPGQMPPTVERLIASYREILGGEKFLKIVPKLDPVAGSANEIFAAAGLSVDSRIQLFDYTRTALAALSQAPDPATALKIRAKLATDAKLDPQQLSLFDATRLGNVLAHYPANGFPPAPGVPRESH